MNEQPGQRKLSRKEREYEFRVNLVLDAAEEVFADYTYADASVEDIAQRAEISVGTLYNLFRSKEEIYKRVVSRAQQFFFDTVTERIDAAHGPHEKMRVAVGYFVEHFARYGRQMKLYASATNGFQWELKSKLIDEAQSAQARFHLRLTEICQQGLDEGIFKKGVPADILSMSLISIPHAFLMAWLGTEGENLLDLVPQALKIADRVVGADVD